MLVLLGCGHAYEEEVTKREGFLCACITRPPANRTKGKWTIREDGSLANTRKEGCRRKPGGGRKAKVKHMNNSWTSEIKDMRDSWNSAAQPPLSPSYKKEQREVVLFSE